MKKKILVEAERLRYPNSGIANVSKALIKGLYALDSDFLFKFYGESGSLDNAFAGRILPWKPWHRFLAPDISGFDLVHTSHQLSRHFHRMGRAQKKIVTLHDLNFLHDQSSDRKIQKSVARVQHNIGNADAIAFISNFAKNDFERNAHLFRLKKNVRTEVVYNGLIFPEKQDFWSEQYAYLRNQPYLLNIGVLFPKKNQKVLLPLLQGNDKRLVVVASDFRDNYREEFLSEAKKYGVAERVELLENISENDKYFLIQNCESLCQPSLAEGFGIPPVEALYFGKPVFLSRFTSLPEIGGDAAFYFENFDQEAMKKRYEEGLAIFRQKNMSETVAKYASKFSYLEMAKNYLALYESVLGG